MKISRNNAKALTFLAGVVSTKACEAGKSGSRWLRNSRCRNFLWWDTCRPWTTSARIPLNAGLLFRSFSSIAARRTESNGRTSLLMFSATGFCGNRGRSYARAFWVRERQQIRGTEPRRLSGLVTPPYIDPVSHFASPGKQNFSWDFHFLIFVFHLEWFAVAFVSTFPIGRLAISRAIKHELTSRALLLRLATAHLTICHNFTRPCSRKLITLGRPALRLIVLSGFEKSEFYVRV